MAKAVDKMERMRKMVGMPKLRVPTYAELLDGSWWAKVGNIEISSLFIAVEDN